MAATDALVFDAIRTPRGRGKSNGSLHTTKPVDLVVGLMHEMLIRNDHLDPNRVDDVVLGCVSPVGDQGADIAKTAAIKAGLPHTVAGVQLNRFCASGLEAVNIAAQKVASGWEDLVLAGGVESMSRVPMGSDGGAWAMDPETNYDTSFVPQGISADLIATIEEFSREDVDAYAARSQEQGGGGPRVGQVLGQRDPGQGPQRERRPGRTTSSSARAPRWRRWASSSRRSRSWARWAALTPLPSRSTTGSRRSTTSTRPGNSSGIVDGASLVAVGNEQTGKDLGMEPKARILATAVSGADPDDHAHRPGAGVAQGARAGGHLQGRPRPD